MLGRDKKRFVLAAGHVDSSIDQAPEVAGESLFVAMAGDIPIGDRIWIEEQGHHTPHAGQGMGDTGSRRRGIQANSKPRGELFESCIRRIVAQDFQSGNPRCCGHGVAAECTGLKYAADRQHAVHDLRFATVGANRHSAADDLAQRRDVGRDAEQ